MKLLTALFISLRHYLLHLGVAIVFALILNNLFPVSFLPLIVATLIVDLDHLFSLKNNKRFNKVLKETESHDDLAEKLEKDTKFYWGSEKGFNRLYLHNFFAAAAFILMFIFFFVRGDVAIYSFLLGILVHQGVDILGDLVRWKNVKNWE